MTTDQSAGVCFLIGCRTTYFFQHTEPEAVGVVMGPAPECDVMWRVTVVHTLCLAERQVRVKQK